jgi:hypothetical protein
MILYRIQHKDTASSMWYNPDGSPNRLVDQLTDKKLAALPMEYDDRYHSDGRIWQCACDSLVSLDQWFSIQDRQELFDMGFVLTKFNAEEYVKEENQVLFTRRSITDLEYLDYFLRPSNN